MTTVLQSVLHVPIDSIKIENRQRKKHLPAAIQALKRSILTKGLLHPPVVTQDFRLVAGEGRIRAMQELHEEGLTFVCGTFMVPLGKTPYTYISELTLDDLAEAELEENILRTPLTWMEETEALALIHTMREQNNPKQTINATAKEVSAITGESNNHTHAKISQALIVAANKHNPKVKSANSLREAFVAIVDEQETKYRAMLAKKFKVADLPHKIIQGDCREVMKTLPAGQFSAIICDPPYGIEADKMGREEEHFYDDSPENALDICKAVIREGFRLTKTRALLFLFCDIEHFIDLRTFAAQHAWTPWRTPVIWRKGTDGHAPWGRAGFVRTYECILFASKGRQELRMPGGPDVLEYKRPSRGDRVHAAEKPGDLLSLLLKLSCLEGDSVLDPCAGSGSIIPMASDLKIQATCIELSEVYYQEALARLVPLKDGKK